jgi:hypothetical protein
VSVLAVFAASPSLAWLLAEPLSELLAGGCGESAGAACAVLSGGGGGCAEACASASSKASNGESDVRPELDAVRAGFGSEGLKAGVVASDATDGTAALRISAD